MPVVAAVDKKANEQILIEAELLASDRDLELHVVYVLGESEFKKLEETSVDETGQPIDIETIRSFATEVADKVASESVSDYKPVGLEGEEANRIIQYSSEVDADYVVIGGRKRTPVGKAVFGSVSQAILLNVDCPTLLVKE